MAASNINVLVLYRHILKAAAQYPSVKRAGIIRDIKAEFRVNRDLKDSEKVLEARKLALDGLKRIEDFTGAVARSMSLNARVLSANMAARCKVLFCTKQFPWGFKFTQEALRADAGVEVVACDSTEVTQHIADATIAVPFMAGLDDSVLAHAHDLRLIEQYGVGVEGVDIDAVLTNDGQGVINCVREQATRRGIYVSKIPSAGMGNALSCAEHIFHLTLSLLRDMRGMAASIEKRCIGQPLGQTLAGKRVLLFGLGSIAAELLPRLKAFQAETTVVRVRQQPPEDDAAELRQHIDHYGAGIADLHRLLPTADIVALTCSQTEATRGIVDRAFLSACKPGVLIVNVARGGLLDYNMVREGLESGRIGGMGLDVAWEEPLDPADPVLSHPSVLLTPHVAGVTELSYRNMADKLAIDVRRIQQGLPPTIKLNDPLLRPSS